MRNMSFALTTRQMRRRTKSVTRRLGWWKLKAGELLCAVEKSQGLKKGEKVKRVSLIRVVSARNERLCDITQEDVVREGFPEMSPADFIAMFCQHHGIKPRHTVRRIEFSFV
jgi:hypothetical protein